MLKVFFLELHDFRLKGFVRNLHNLGLNVFPLNVGGVRVVGLGVRPHRPGGRGGGGDDSIPLVWELEVVVLLSRLVGMGGVRGVGWVGDRVLLGVVGRGQGSTPAQGTTPAGWVGGVVRLVPKIIEFHVIRYKAELQLKSNNDHTKYEPQTKGRLI